MGLGYLWYATGGDQLQALGVGGILAVAGLLFVRSWVRSPPKVPPGTTTHLPVFEPEPEKFDEPREPGRPYTPKRRVDGPPHLLPGQYPAHLQRADHG